MQLNTKLFADAQPLHGFRTRFRTLVLNLFANKSVKNGVLYGTVPVKEMCIDKNCIKAENYCNDQKKRYFERLLCLCSFLSFAAASG
jgi:hypothetical protein